jgi:tripartite ATP-independent transporter DctM subunit
MTREKPERGGAITDQSGTPRSDERAGVDLDIQSPSATSGAVVPTDPWSGAKWLDRSLETILAVAIVGQLVVLLLNVFTRSFLGFSLLWSQEVAQLTLNTVAFVGGAVAYPRAAHTSVEALVIRLPPKWRPAIAAAVDWAVCAMGLGALLLSLTPLLSDMNQQTQVLHMSQFWLDLPLSVGMALIVYFALRRLWLQPRKLVLLTGAVVAVIVALLAVFVQQEAGALDPSVILAVDLSVLIILLLLGVPIGFVLIIASILYLYLDGGTSPIAVPMGMLQGANSFVLLAVPFFVLAGALMSNAGLTAPLARFISSFVGHFRGGLLHVVVLTMYIFSGISGSKVADVAAVGTTMRPMLDERGYQREEMVAVLSASAIMGETVPPSIGMLVLSSITTVSTGALFSAGLVPAAIVGICIIALIVVRSRKHGGDSIPKSTWRTRGVLSYKAVPALILPVGLVAGILFGVATPTEISAVAVLYAVLLAALGYRTLTLELAWRTMIEAATMAGMVLFIITAATPFAQTLTLAGIPQAIAAGIASLGGSTVLFLLATIVALVIMGQLLEGLPALLIFGPLLVPLAPQFGVNPLQYALVLIFAMGLGSFAPPVGVGFYVSCAVGGTSFERSIRHFLPYAAVLIVGLLLVAFVPWFSLVIPNLVGGH